MTITLTERIDVHNITNANALTTASFTPANSSILWVVGICMTNGGGLPANNPPTISDSLTSTWTPVTNVSLNQTFGIAITAVRTSITTGASMTVTMTPGENCYKRSILVFDTTGGDTTTPVGGTRTASAASDPGALSGSLSAAPANSGDYTIAALMVDDTAASTTTEAAGWNAQMEDVTGSVISHVMTRTASTSATVAYTDTSTGAATAYGHLAFVIQDSAAAAASLVVPRLPHRGLIMR